MSVTTRLAIVTAALGVALFLVWPDRASRAEAPLAPDGVSRTQSAARETASGPAPRSTARVEGVPQRPQDEGPVLDRSPGATGVLDQNTEPAAPVAPGATGPSASRAWPTARSRVSPSVATFDVEVSTDRAGKPLVIVLGAASIVGHVYDDEGGPVMGTVVGLDRIGTYVQRLGTIFAETDTTGRFGFHDLLPEVYRVSLVTLSGRTRGDDRPRQPGRGALRGAARVVARGVRAAARPGRYGMRVRVTTSDSGLRTDYLELGDVAVPEADFEHDLTLPGTSVRGRVTGVVPERLPQNLTLSVYSVDSPRPVQSASVGHDGTFVLCALEPGEYRVDPWPGVTVAPGTGLLVREGDRVLTLDVPVAPR